MKILVSYRGIPQSPGWATGDMAVKALRAMGHFAVPYARNYKEETWVEQRDEEWTQENKLQEVSRQEWDLVLFMECNDDEAQYTELKGIRARKKACWLFDTSYYPDQCEGLARWFAFDHIFLANPLTLDYYRAKGLDNTNYLPYACDRELHYRPLEHALSPGEKRKHECALVGSIRADRVELVEHMKAHGVDLTLIGNVFREDYVDALASAAIIINQNPEAGRGLLNMRWFEAPAAGALVLGEWADLDANVGVLDGWFLGHHSVASMINYIEHLLSSPTELAIARQGGQNHILGHHTYEHRCQTILDTMFPHEN